MKCLKCGAYVYSSDKFCRSCGTTLTQETCKYGDNISNSKYDSKSCHTKQYDYSNEYSHTKKDSDTKYNTSYEYDDKYTIDQSKYTYAMPTDSGGDDKYVKAYIGQNYQGIKKMKISIPALIFGPWYLLYRKVWGYAIAIIIISVAAQLLLTSNLKDFVNIIINIFVAFKFQSIYMKQAENKVEEIKQQNLDKTTNELLDICRKKGGVSTKAPLIAFVITIFVAISAIILFFEEYTPQNNNQEIVEEESTDITYTLPVGFNLVYNNGDYKRYEYIESSTKCNITLDKTKYIDNYPDEKAYLESHINTRGNPTYKVSEVTPIILNNQEWKFKCLETPSSTETQYVHKTDKAIHIIKTHDYKNNNTKNIICDIKYKEFLNTVKIK